MTASITTLVRGLVPKLEAGVDAFFIAGWWWRYRRRRAEHRLTRVLDRYGDKSIEARRATEKCRDMEFAVRFWRPAIGPIQQVARNALASGVPIEAVRFAITSGALGMKGTCVVLRCSYALAIISAAMSLVVFGESIVACVVSLLIPGHVMLKGGLLLAVAGVDLIMWRAWTLWWIQPRKTIKQWGAMLERSCKHVRCGASVCLLAANP